jgi:hypothetical protein
MILMYLEDNPILYFEVGNVTPLGLDKIDVANSGMFKRVLESNAYGKLLGSYRDKIFITIIVAVIGLSVAVILGQQWILNKQNQRIFDLTQQIVNLTKSDDVFIPQLTRILRSIIK